MKILCPTRYVVDATESAKKDAWRPRCAAPSLVSVSTLFFQTFMHIYIRTIYDQIYLAKIERENTPRLRSRDGHVEHFSKTSGSIS